MTAGGSPEPASAREARLDLAVAAVLGDAERDPAVRTELDDLVRAFQRTGRLGPELTARLALLSLELHGEGWGRHYLAAEAILQRHRVADPRLVALAERGADAALQAHRAVPSRAMATRALRALALAHRLCEPLGDWERLRALSDRMDRVAAEKPLVPVGAFDLRAPVGAGGMGTVWEAEALGTGRPVAVKVMPGGGTTVARELLRAEMRAAARLDHRHITRVLDFGEAGDLAEAASNGLIGRGSPFLAMELAPEGSLLPHVTRLTWGEVLAVLLSLLDALAHAHARGVVHLDIKPSNLLVGDASGAIQAVKLTDFGVARSIHEGGTPDIFGTLAYMSPEQLRGRWREYGPWTDLFAVGCLTARLVTGRAPFQGLDPTSLREAQLHLRPPRMKPRMPVPTGLQGWVNRCLAKDTRDRFQRAVHAAQALLELGPPDLEGPLAVVAPPPVAPAETCALTMFPPEPGAADVAWAAPRPEITERPTVTAIEARSPIEPGLALFGVRDPPFVGRDAERERLWQALDRTIAHGEVRFVQVTGPAGVGKSRLTRQLAQRADESIGVHWVRAKHGPMEATDSALVRAFTEFLRADGLTGDTLGYQIEQRLGLLGVPELASELCSVLDPTPRHDDGRRREVALSGLLIALARRCPVVFEIDDAQWGEAALSLVHALMSAGGGGQAPVLVLANVREDALTERPVARAQLAALSEGPRGEVLALRAMSAVECGALIRAHLPVERSLAGRLVQRTAGNPLFAAELLRDLVERRALTPGPDGWRLAAGATLELPGDLHHLWTARLERLLEGLSDSALRALEVAAVLGVDVSGAEWAAVCRDLGIELDARGLERLLAARLAEGVSTRWHFTQGMLRESLQRSARDHGRLERAHAACARVLARGTDPRSLARRGRHLFAAGQLEEAVSVLYAAATQAREVGRLDEGIALLTLRTEALDALGVGDVDLRRVEGWLERSSVVSDRYQAPPEPHLTRRAVEVARELGDLRLLGRATRMAGSDALQSGRYDEAERYFAEAIVLMAGDDKQLGRCHEQLYDLSVRTGRLAAAAEHARLSRDFFEASGDFLGLTAAMEAQAALQYREQQLDGLDDLLRRIVERYQGRGMLRRSVWAQNYLGEVLRQRGDLEGADAAYQALLDLSERIGHFNIVVARLNLGLVSIQRGDFETGRTRAALALECASAGSIPYLTAVAHGLCLATLAPTAPESEWQVHLAPLQHVFGRGDAYELDVVRIAEVAAERARAGGLDEVAEQLDRLVAHQRAGLQG